MNARSFASVRTDPVHYQLSLATRLEPSPDWFVGVSGLNLCLPNCTWLDNKLINLYPWDGGTDAGYTYTVSDSILDCTSVHCMSLTLSILKSPDRPQIPPDVIRGLRSDSRIRSPFYEEESGTPMKPLAQLHIKRQRIYERRCKDDDCR